MLCGRAFLIYLAADSQNRARRPPRPEISTRNKGNRDQHYGAKKKKTAGAGARTEKGKPHEKTKRPRGAGENRVQKRETADAWARAKRRRPRPKKKGRRGLTFSNVSRGVRRIVDTSRGRGGRVGVVLAQITRAAYPRRNPAQITRGATLLTPSPNPRAKAISAGRKFGAGSSRAG